MMLPFIDSLWTWLLTPLSGSAVHTIDSAVSWHGRLMVLAWGVLMPLGVVTARFFKVTPKQLWPQQLDNKTWWHAHLLAQSLGLVIALIGLALIYNMRSAVSDTAAAQWHGYAGWVVLALGLLQGTGGMLRGTKGGPTDTSLRGDHYDMTRRRRVFEWLHKSAGYTALILAIGVISAGLYISDAPRWMPLSLGAWWLGLVLLWLSLQRRGLCIDTYQAIWGNSLAHPGNTLAPAGWGSQRYSTARFIAAFNTRPSAHTTNHTQGRP